MLRKKDEETPKGELPKSTKLVASGKWLELRKVVHPGLDIKGYEYMHEKLGAGKMVSALPYRKSYGGLDIVGDTVSNVEYLLRLEIVPAWSLEERVVSLTGKIDVGESPVWAALRELEEESGFSVDEDELVMLGTSRASKAADTIIFLFSVDLTDAVEGRAKGDGSHLEDIAHCEWGDKEVVLKSLDPLVHVMFNRLNESIRDQSDMKIHGEWFEEGTEGAIS